MNTPLFSLRNLVLLIVFLATIWATVFVLNSPKGSSASTPPARPADPPILSVYPEDAYLPEATDQQNEVENKELLSGFQIIDMHEHVQFEADGLRLLDAMKQSGISRSCLLGASLYTFTLDPRYGFEQLRANNKVILDLKRQQPQRFCAFVTIDPDNPRALESLKELVEQGADGIKLYLGHGESTGKGPFHTMALDSPKMLPIYQWAEENGLPITYHVNLIKFYDEFERVMQRFPRLKVNLPHFGLHSNSWSRLSALGRLLDTYPNLYFDMSYGWYVFHIQGFENLAANRTMLRAFIERYSDRALFGADSVVESSKDVVLLTKKLTSYRQILELPTFRFYLKPEKPLYGLSLPSEVLRKIYLDNPLRFLQGDMEKIEVTPYVIVYKRYIFAFLGLMRFGDLGHNHCVMHITVRVMKLF